MRKLLSWMSVVILIPLVACSFGLNNPRPAQPAAGITPSLSSEQMQTQLAQLLTMMPTGTGQPVVEATPTVVLPTVAVATETATLENPEAAPKASPTPAPAITATDTPQPAPPASTATAAPAAGGGQVAAATGTTVSGTAPASAAAATLGTPASVDPMNDSFTWNWPTGNDQYTEASFSNGQQAIKALTTKDGWRLANPNGQQFTNIYLETNFVVKDICHKDIPGMADHYGVIVRVPDIHQPVNGYLFSFNCNGEYSLRSWSWNGEDERRQDMKMLIDWTPNSVIRSGPQTTNVMGIKMIGSQIWLYANGNYLNQYDFSKNTTVPQLYAGYFGAFVGSRTDTKFTIWVDQMAYWLNPQP